MLHSLAIRIRSHVCQNGRKAPRNQVLCKHSTHGGDAHRLRHPIPATGQRTTLRSRGRAAGDALSPSLPIIRTLASPRPTPRARRTSVPNRYHRPSIPVTSWRRDSGPPRSLIAPWTRVFAPPSRRVRSILPEERPTPTCPLSRITLCPALTAQSTRPPYLDVASVFFNHTQASSPPFCRQRSSRRRSALEGLYSSSTATQTSA
ncbi:hypothetical protein BD414DRAFT_494233 [Trametes punicea]|nr:hypothetical protein BD414DRAFT_494233 [Trametes punicea]